MILKKGQIVNDGINNLVVCDIRYYKDNWYAYMLNELTDDVAFYKVIIGEENYDFIKISNEDFLEKLIMFFTNENIKDKKINTIIDNN